MKKALFCLSMVVASTLGAQETPVKPRVILPLVGRLSAADGGYWTDVRFDGAPGLTIRVIFHPAGAVAKDSDPWMKFYCGGPRCFARIPDIVGAIGATAYSEIRDGIGSLEIVPDVDNPDIQVVPDVFARIVRVRNGPNAAINFGAVVPAVTNKMIADLAAAGPQTMLVPGTDANVRRSVGFRTITPITYSATVINNATGLERVMVSGATLPPDYTLFSSLDALLGEHLSTLDDVRIDIESGTAIAFYTYTHNVTGEPTVVVPDVASEFRSRAR